MTVCVQIGEAIVYQIRRHQAGTPWVDQVRRERGTRSGQRTEQLARRGTVPVDVHFDVEQRLPESAEVAADNIVAEAVANTAKHALNPREIESEAEAPRCVCRSMTTASAARTLARVWTHRRHRSRRGARGPHRHL
jgi:hypothetical protein